MEQNINQALLAFIDRSPTAWHAVENLRARLDGAGFRELSEGERWAVAQGGRYYVRRNGSSLIAFRVPREEPLGFMLMAAHVDSPSFQIKSLDSVVSAGAYTQLNVEPYGGMLMATWLDRPLSAAGRVVLRRGDTIGTQLVNIDRDLLLIPNLAIHMDRKANEEKRYDAKTDMLPLLGLVQDGKSFRTLVAEEAGVDEGAILSADLRLYPRTPGTVWGMDGAFVSAPRLDDLQCVYACLEGFLAAEESPSAAVFCAFDNEEVGSRTRQGADSRFLEDTLLRLCESLGLGAGDYRRLLAESMMVSADNAHAVHPNHPEYADRADRPVLNGGVVLKFNAAQRYTSDAVSAAVFAEICRRAGVPVQRYSNRADLPGGSTLGHISLTHVSVCSVDAGLAQLAMHSCYETAGARDTVYMIRAAREFYSSALRSGAGGYTIAEQRRPGE